MSEEDYYDLTVVRGGEPELPHDMHRLILQLYVTGYYNPAHIYAMLGDDGEAYEEEEDSQEMLFQTMEPVVRAHYKLKQAREDAKDEWFRWCKSRLVCKIWKQLADEIIHKVGKDMAVSPLNIAARGGFVESCVYLLSTGAFDPSVDNDGTFFDAISSKKLEIVSALIKDKRVNPAARNNWGLVQSTLANDLEIFKLILEDQRVNPGDHDNTVLIYACRNENPEFTRLLLSHALVDPSAQNNEALVTAAQVGMEKNLRLLLADPRVDPTAQDNKAIVWAVTGGYYECVKLLLEDGRANPSVQNNHLLEWAEKRHTGKFPQIYQELIKDSRVLELKDLGMKERFQSMKRGEDLHPLFPLHWGEVVVGDNGEKLKFRCKMPDSEREVQLINSEGKIYLFSTGKTHENKLQTSLVAGVGEFERLFIALTGHNWADKANYEPREGMHVLLDESNGKPIRSKRDSGVLDAY